MRLNEGPKDKIFLRFNFKLFFEFIRVLMIMNKVLYLYVKLIKRVRGF